MANDLSFLEKKKMTFWEIPYLGLGKGKWKPSIYLLNFTVCGVPREFIFVMAYSW